MNTTREGGVQILHALPGRLRLHLTSWAGRGPRGLEQQVRRLPGIRHVEANPVTHNLLVTFDPHALAEPRLLEAIHAAEQGAAAAPETEEPLPPAVREKTAGRGGRARIAVRGLDRDPHLGRRVVELLRQHPGVRTARASPLTGRVLVEFDEHRTELDDLLSLIATVELPPLPGEDRPAHPLDPKPLWQSTTRATGAALGLSLLAARRLMGLTGRPRGAHTAALSAAVLGLLRSFPFFRNGLRHFLGPDRADAVFSTATIVSLTLAGSPIGLTMVGAEAFVLLREVLARRSAFRRYEERIEAKSSSLPGGAIRLESGERTPRAARVVEGNGAALGRDGLPVPVVPGTVLSAGARLLGGPFEVQLHEGRAFVPLPRPAPPAPTLAGRYLSALGPVSLAYAAVTAFSTRSLLHTLNALLLVNPRPALIGMESANLDASARVLRGGVTVIGTRRERIIRRPHALLIDGPRCLTDGLEVAAVLPLAEPLSSSEVLSLAAGVCIAAGSPWGNAFSRAGAAAAVEGRLEGTQASAAIGEVRYTLGPTEDWNAVPESAPLRQRGFHLLLLRRQPSGRPLAVIALRPRLASGIAELVKLCKEEAIQLALIPAGDPLAARAVAKRARVPLATSANPLALVRSMQQRGAVVALVSDCPSAAPAFEECDLAVGLSSGRSSRFPARVDLLAPDLCAVSAIIEAGARRDATVRDSVLFSTVSNVAGAVWGLRQRPGVEQASLAVYLASLAGVADGLIRLSGGKRSGASLAFLADPHPERWGRQEIPAVLKALRSRPEGLTSEEATQRRRSRPTKGRRFELVNSVLDQFRYPTTGILAGAAGFSLFLGHPLDSAVIGATILVNVAVGAWQERQADQAAEALQQMGTATARVLRDGRPVVLPASQVVPGDVLLLAPGDRVAADARLLDDQGLEVDEAALTGESLPVPKMAEHGTAESQVVLEGSDVVVGTGRAAVVAVGRQTRLGATAAALSVTETEQSPLGARLSRLLWESLPLTAAGGALVVAGGFLRGRALLPQLAIGASLALASVPEGLPLLAGMGQAGVARRLARRRALVRRLSAVEALGRVDVACTDKTGTLTAGRLAVSLVSDGAQEAKVPGELNGDLRYVLLAAGLASPHPQAADALSHPTDVAVMEAARAAGLTEQLHQPRQAEAPFDPSRSFHASVVDGRMCLKGAAEVLVPRCTRLRRSGQETPLDEIGHHQLLMHAWQLSGRGLRVLMVAEGPATTDVEEPQDLVALGFVAISDPLRPTVAAAVQRCHEAGVRVIMITGDHPATARAIAREAGLIDGDGEIVTGAELAELQNGELEERLKRVIVVARATPLDKLRIIEGLQRQGHTVAMTGDGVNDAPALRLADVGVAMGKGGTEVARQAADVVLADDDFSTLVEALVEGRGFWQNIRRALGLLLGGNLGEMGLIVGTTAVGLVSPLNSRQILVMNLITDALPALAVVLREPRQRQLSSLAREGLSALDNSLRRDVLRRGSATALPALGAFLLARGFGAEQAGTVAYGSIIGNQLAQTLDAGLGDGTLDRSVLGAVGSSGAMLAASLLVPSLRQILGLALPTAGGWTLMSGAAVVSVLLGRLLPGNGANGNGKKTPGRFVRVLPRTECSGVATSRSSTPAQG